MQRKRPDKQKIVRRKEKEGRTGGEEEGKEDKWQNLDTHTKKTMTVSEQMGLI